MKMHLQKLKQIDYRHYIGFLLLAGSVALLFFRFSGVFGRIGEGLRDVYTSARFYVSELFELGLSGEITVNNYSSVPMKLPFNLPDTWEGFKLAWGAYWQLIIDGENLGKYADFLGNVLLYISKGLLVLMPVVLAFFVIRIFKGEKQNTDHGKKSRPLLRYLVFEKKLLHPVFRWIKETLDFVFSSFWGVLLLVVWALNFNVFGIIFEALAFYLYFVSSFDFLNIYRQVLKLFMDLSFVLNFVPGVIWAAVALWGFHAFRCSIGFSRLEGKEQDNRDFIEERPIVSMICGTMGTKKTTTLTDMAISKQIMLREEAFNRLLRADLKFPFFPWINLEMSLKKAIDHHTVFNLATCKRFVRSKWRKFEKHQKRQYLFMYDFERYGLIYNDDLGDVPLWKILEDYAQLYFMYIVESSYIIGNYSVRTDDVMQSVGNFPLWDHELFRKGPELVNAYSRHAHILDFDTLRLGKKVIEDNPNADSFEFGIVLVTEIGKERKNAVELQGIKKVELDTNQKNDGFNDWLKMIRHSATVDNFPFVCVISDEQRPESWGADARQLCDIIHIDECSRMKLAMPFFALEDLFLGSLIDRHKRKYYEYRYNRGDITLFMYLWHGFIGRLQRYRSRIYNTFGYYQQTLQIEKGTQDGAWKEEPYFLMWKKIYSFRFSTDCFSEFFNNKALKAIGGIDDIVEYRTEKASIEELKQQNSYFIADLLRKKGE